MKTPHCPHCQSFDTAWLGHKEERDDLSGKWFCIGLVFFCASCSNEFVHNAEMAGSRNDDSADRFVKTEENP
jgi:hypothetical protein